MAHQLEQTPDGRTSFAYSSTYGSAWHRLGVRLEGLQGLDEILTAARADYVVHKSKLVTPDPRVVTDDPLESYGAESIIDSGQWFTWRERPRRRNTDGQAIGTEAQVLGVVGKDYHTVQNRALGKLAFALIGEMPDSDAADCAGVLNDGRRFFMTLPLPPLVVDPDGIADVHNRFLVATTSHDGRYSVQLVNSITRAVCANTVDAALRKATRLFTIRHTRSADIAISQAKKQLGLLLSADEQFEVTAMDLLRLDASWSTVEKVANILWPKPDPADSSQRQRTNHERRLQALSSIWTSPTGSAGVGQNGWAAFNTLSEYLEHRSPLNGRDTPKNRARRMIRDDAMIRRINSLPKLVTVAAGG